MTDLRNSIALPSGWEGCRSIRSTCSDRVRGLEPAMAAVDLTLRPGRKRVLSSVFCGVATDLDCCDGPGQVQLDGIDLQEARVRPGQLLGWYEDETADRWPDRSFDRGHNQWR